VPSIHQVLAWAQEKVARGDGELHTNHITVIEEQAKKRATNAPDDEGRRKTKIAWEAGDPDSYANWHKERERWMVLAKKNPTMATDAMIIALRLYTDEDVREILDNLQNIAEPI
jgi:hypothetical protein